MLYLLTLRSRPRNLDHGRADKEPAYGLEVRSCQLLAVDEKLTFIPPCSGGTARPRTFCYRQMAQRPHIASVYPQDGRLRKLHTQDYTSRPLKAPLIGTLRSHKCQCMPNLSQQKERSLESARYTTSPGQSVWKMVAIRNGNRHHCQYAQSERRCWRRICHAFEVSCGPREGKSSEANFVSKLTWHRHVIKLMVMYDTKA